MEGLLCDDDARTPTFHPALSLSRLIAIFRAAFAVASGRIAIQFVCDTVFYIANRLLQSALHTLSSSIGLQTLLAGDDSSGFLDAPFDILRGSLGLIFVHGATVSTELRQSSLGAQPETDFAGHACHSAIGDTL